MTNQRYHKFPTAIEPQPGDERRFRNPAGEKRGSEGRREARAAARVAGIARPADVSLLDLGESVRGVYDRRCVVLQGDCPGIAEDMAARVVAAYVHQFKVRSARAVATAW